MNSMMKEVYVPRNQPSYPRLWGRRARIIASSVAHLWVIPVTPKIDIGTCCDWSLGKLRNV